MGVILGGNFPGGSFSSASCIFSIIYMDLFIGVNKTVNFHRAI